MVNLTEYMPVLAYFRYKRIGKRVYAGNAHAVQSRRNFIAARLIAAAELAARVEVGKRKFNAAYARDLVYTRGNTPAVIANGSGALTSV